MRKTGMKVLFFVTLWFYTVSLSAGTYSDSLTQNTKRYRIGFTATALINKLPGLQLTQTYRLNRWFSADLETIFSLVIIFWMKGLCEASDIGFVRGLRFYLTPNKENHNFSFKVLIHYRNVKIDFEDNGVIRANGAYIEDIKESVYSELIGYGATFDYSVNNFKHMAHFGLGFVIGNQFTRYSSQEIPDNGYTFMQSIMTRGRKRAFLPLLYIHYLF
jgi:hypothetical protein